MDVGLDTGDMLYKLSCPILQKIPVVRCTTSWQSLAHKGYHHVETTGRRHGETRSSGRTLVTYAEKLSKEEARIDWSLRQHSLNAAFALSIHGQ